MQHVVVTPITCHACDRARRVEQVMVPGQVVVPGVLHARGLLAVHGSDVVLWFCSRRAASACLILLEGHMGRLFM